MNTNKNNSRTANLQSNSKLRPSYAEFLKAKGLKPIAAATPQQDRGVSERKVWLAKLPIMSSSDSIVWLQEPNPNKQLHPVIKPVFRQAPEPTSVPKVRRVRKVRREGVENVPVLPPQESSRIYRESLLWADQQYSRAVAKAKAMEKAGLRVPEEAKRTGLYPFPQGSELAAAQAVLAHEGFVAVLAPDADRSSPYVREHDMAAWVAAIVREVIAELERNKTVVRASARPELEEEYDAIQDQMGRRYLPNGKRKFRPEGKAPRVSSSRSGSAPVAAPAPKAPAQKAPSRSVQPEAPRPVVADLVSAHTGVSRRAW